MRHVFAGLLLAVILLVSGQYVEAAPRLLATFMANDCSFGGAPQRCGEPMEPYFLARARGCGFIVGREVLIRDEVVLHRGLWPIDPLYEGQYRVIEDRAFPDANGCLVFSYQGWGSGLHHYTLFQNISPNNTGNMKRVAEDWADTWFHHLWSNISYQPPWPYTGDIYYIPPEYIPPGVTPILNIDAYACMTYWPPRTVGSPFWMIGEPNNYDFCFPPR